MGISENFHSYILLFFLSHSLSMHEENFLACMFCFLISVHLTQPQGTVSFNFFGVHVHTHA